MRSGDFIDLPAAALIRPDDGRGQRLAVTVHHHCAVHLAGEAHGENVHGSVGLADGAVDSRNSRLPPDQPDLVRHGRAQDG